MSCLIYSALDKASLLLFFNEYLLFSFVYIKKLKIKLTLNAHTCFPIDMTVTFCLISKYGNNCMSLLKAQTLT